MRDPNKLPGELTAETRAARGTADTVEMVDPSGNRCAVSLRHHESNKSKDKVILEKLDAGWTFPPPAEPPASSGEGTDDARAEPPAAGEDAI